MMPVQIKKAELIDHLESGCTNIIPVEYKEIE